MKLNLKTIAAAVALVAAGSAHADIVGGANSSLVITAFNTVTKSYYLRDTGFLLNGFLPSSIITASGDGGVTGDKTPETGLILDKNNTATFADSAFSTWLGTQNVADIRWTAFATDVASLAGNTNVSRLTLASSTALPSTVTNTTVTNASGIFNTLASTGAGGVNPIGLSTTGATVLSLIEGNLIGTASTLGTLGSASNLFYITRTQGTLATSTGANITEFGNSLNFAQVTLATNGDFSYSLAPAAVSAVPVPAAAWLMGSGLMALGGAVRRRKAAAQA